MLKGSGAELLPYSQVSWDATLKKMAGLKLGSKEFILINIELLKDDTGLSTDYNHETEVKVYSTPDKIVIEGVPSGNSIRLYNISGILRKETISVGDKNEIIVAEKGVFMIRTGQKSVKVIVI